MTTKVVIIGASIAGINVMNTLVNNEFDGEIMLIDQKDTLPYNPYKLTKDWMLDLDNITPPLLKKEAYYAKHNIDLKLNTKVVSFNPESKIITTHDNQNIAYDKLVIATGSKLNKLPIEANNLRYLRTFNQALEIKKLAKRSHNITILGAGFIGLELAATLSELGKQVHVIFRHSLPLEKTLGKRAAQYIFDLLQSKDVKFITNDAIETFNINNNLIESYTTKNGLTLNADLVIGAIGVKPHLPLEHPNLKTDIGILVNKVHQTSIPDVYAAGDNTQFPYKDKFIHLEHWESAYYSGINIAKNILNNNQTPYDIVPYFWTDLYDETFEYLGYTDRFEHAYVRQSEDPKKFMVAYTDEHDKLLAILFTNKIAKRKDIAKFLEETHTLDPQLFSNIDVDLI